MTLALRRPGVHPAAADAGELLGRSVDLRGFRLGGGTALAWHLGHRISVDLDFFSFTPGILAADEVPALAAALRVADSAANPVMSDRTVHAHVRGCSVSFFEIEGAWIDPPSRVAEGIEVASLGELAAMKLVAVMTRCAKKDFYDLAAIAESGLTIHAMVDRARHVFPSFEQAIGHLQRSLVYFDEAEVDPDPVLLVKTSWSAVKQAMRLLAADLRG